MQGEIEFKKKKIKKKCWGLKKKKKNLLHKWRMLLNGLSSRLDLAKKKISELEDVLFQMFKTKKQKQKEKRKW